MRKNSYKMTLSALLLSACLLLSPAPTQARQSTVVRTENVLPAMEPAKPYSSDWLSEEEGGSGILRLDPWLLPDFTQGNAEEPPSGDPEDPSGDPIDLTGDPGEDPPADPGTDPPTDPGDPGEDPPADPGENAVQANAVPTSSRKTPLALDDEGIMIWEQIEISERSNKKETFTLENPDDFVYNSLLSNAENRDVLAFFAFVPEGETLSESDFRVSFYDSPPADVRNELLYLIPTLVIQNDRVSLDLALDQSVLDLDDPIDVYIEIAWKTMVAQAVIRLFPYGTTPTPIIDPDAVPTDVLDVSVSDLSALRALQATAAGDWRLRLSYTETEKASITGETVFVPVNRLGCRTAGEETIYLSGDAAFLIPANAQGRVLLDLSHTDLGEKTGGTLRLESFGADLPDSLSPIPEAKLDSFILSPVSYYDDPADDVPGAYQAQLSVDPTWLGCTLSYQLQQLDTSGQFLALTSFQNMQIAAGEDLKLSLYPTAEGKLSAGSYRLTIIWSLPGGTPLYESTVSFFISY